MPQAIQFDGNGDAQFPVPYQYGTFGISFYIKASNSNETILASPTYIWYGGKWIGTEGFAVFLLENGAIATENQYRLDGAVQSQYTWYFDAKIPLDGKTWHQITLQTSDRFATTCVLYMDGMHIKPSNPSASKIVGSSRPRSVPSEPSPPTDIYTYTGKVVFGRDALNIQPQYPNFSGCLTEIRMYSNSSFPLLTGLPVDAKAPNLVYYWPMWITSSNPLVDSTSGQQLFLDQNVSVFTTSEAIYTDLLCEVIANTKPINFNDFSAGNEKDAFIYLLKQANFTNYTPASWRALYQQESMQNAFTDVYADITNVTFPTGQPFSEDEFNTVKSTLLAELFGVNLGWGYFDSAANELPYVADKFTSAAAQVISTAESSVVWLRGNKTESVKKDIGEIVEVVAAAAGIIPDYGEIISAAISTTWAVISWLAPDSPGGTPGFAAALLIESNAPQLNAKASEIVQSMRSKLKNSVSVVLGNYGLLKAAGDLVHNGSIFQFAVSLNPDQKELDNLNAVYNYAVNMFSQLLICAAFPGIHYWANQYGDFADDANRGQWNYGDPAWYSHADTYMYIVGVNDGDTWTSLDQLYTNMINDARTYLGIGGVSWGEVYDSWPLVKQEHPPPNESQRAK